MKNKADIIKILKGEFSNLYEKFGIKKIGLFGSYARGEQKEESDIDIIVDFEKPISLFRFIDLEDYLSKILDKKVDLVTPDALKPLIKPTILEEAIYV